MNLWAITLSEDERTVLSVGLSSSVSTPLMDATIGRFIVLFPSEVNALLYVKGAVEANMFKPGEYTIYKVTIPLGSDVQEIRIKYDLPGRPDAHVMALSPPVLPARFIQYVKRKTIL